jgi:outer membrane biosynthesis protein TonB
MLGLTANATAVLAHRAREGLRQAYLRAHISSTLTAEASCARYADRLGAHVREGLRTRADRELRRHLARCARCRLAAAELADVNAALKALLPVAVIGWFATAYVAKAAGVAAGGTAVAGAGAAAGAGGAAGAAGGSSAGGTASGGAAAAEGLGAPVKTAIAAGVVVAAAGVALAVVLTGGGGKAPVQAAKKPSAAPVVPARPSPRPKPRPSSAPPSPTAPAAGSRPAPVMFRTPEQTPKPTPSPTPTPTPSPSPSPSPTPAPQVYAVSQLGHTGIGNGTTPTIRAIGSNWVWQRRGLSAGGRSYSHGLTVSTPSSVLIDLNRACTSYDALAGIDDLALGLGAARFSVYGDGARLWQSGVLHGGDPPVPVHVAVSGRETIRLVVEATNPSQPVNVADWAMPRISCGQ